MSRIMVVDDEASVLTSFEKMLSAQGHEVLTARRAEGHQIADRLWRGVESGPEIA